MAEGPEVIALERSEGDTNRSLTDQIAALAHALWHKRGCPEGSPEDDWFRAEQEIGEQRKNEIIVHEVSRG